VSQIRGAQRQAALLILDRSPPNPLSPEDRQALLTAAQLLLEVDAPAEAAPVFERADEQRRAAQAWGAAGELARMEACLAREQSRQDARRGERDLVARFEDLMLAGQRLAALDSLAGTEAQALRASALDVERRLCAGRHLALRVASGTIVHLAGLPAVLGRDGSCQVMLRDPGVSRRHASLSFEDSRFFVQDAGSRAGTGLGGTRLAGRVSLPPTGELSLGERCRLTFKVHGSGLLELESRDGLDRGLHTWLGAGPLPLAPVLAGGDGLRIILDERSAHIEPACPVRLNGKLVGQSIDVLRGDLIESGDLRLEIA
jgi:hypothetical protein